MIMYQDPSGHKTIGLTRSEFGGQAAQGERAAGDSCLRRGVMIAEWSRLTAAARIT